MIIFPNFVSKLDDDDDGEGVVVVGHHLTKWVDPGLF